MTTEAQVNLFQAVKVHTLGLEATRGVTSGPDLDILVSRIEAARQLLEWLERALELEPSASLEIQTKPPSSFPTERYQILSAAPKRQRRQ